MKGKWEHGGIFSRVFGISLRRRKVKLLQVTLLTGSSEFCVTSLVQFPSLSRFGQPLDWQGSCSAEAVLRSAAREEASGCEHVDAPNTKHLSIRQCYNTQRWIRQGFRHQNWRWKKKIQGTWRFWVPIPALLCLNSWSIGGCQSLWGLRLAPPTRDVPPPQKKNELLLMRGHTLVLVVQPNQSMAGAPAQNNEGVRVTASWRPFSVASDSTNEIVMLS